MKTNEFLAILYITLLVISLLFFKPSKNKMVIDVLEKPNISFYKEELKQEYKEYQQKTNYPLERVILDVNIGINKPFYKNNKETKYLNSPKMLVNKYHYLPKEYIPNNLIDINEYTRSTLKMQKEAYDAFQEMAKDALKENIRIRIISAYRSYEYQEKLYNNYLKNDTVEKVDSYSARPGFSEHQTGLAIDIDNIVNNYNNFHLTKEYNWMQNNAHLYGFILRYPLGKERITGYKYESWHYRYVGRDIAKYIHDNQITYEEYYAMFLE